MQQRTNSDALHILLAPNTSTAKPAACCAAGETPISTLSHDGLISRSSATGGPTDLSSGVATSNAGEKSFASVPAEDPNYACTVSFAAAVRGCFQPAERPLEPCGTPLCWPRRLSGKGRADSMARLKATAKHLRPRHAALCASPAGPRRGAARSVTALRCS